MNAAAANHGQAALDLEEVIRNPLRITQFLRRVAGQRGLVEIHARGVSHPLHSAVLGADRESGVMLDEMLPRSAAAELAEGVAVRVAGQYDGGPFRFDAEVELVGIERNLPFYRLSLPAQLHYRQRRRYHRASVPLDAELTARIEPHTAEFDALEAQVRDLSVGGCRVQVHSEPVRDALRGSRCVLLSPERELVSCRFEPCHIEPSGAGNWVVGGRYIDLDRIELRRLEHVIAALEREMARMRQR